MFGFVRLNPNPTPPPHRKWNYKSNPTHGEQTNWELHKTKSKILTEYTWDCGRVPPCWRTEGRRPLLYNDDRMHPISRGWGCRGSQWPQPKTPSSSPFSVKERDRKTEPAMCRIGVRGGKYENVRVGWETGNNLKRWESCIYHAPFCGVENTLRRRKGKWPVYWICRLANDLNHHRSSPEQDKTEVHSHFQFRIRMKYGYTTVYVSIYLRQMSFLWRGPCWNWIDQKKKILGRLHSSTAHCTESQQHWIRI